LKTKMGAGISTLASVFPHRSPTDSAENPNYPCCSKDILGVRI
jgi:hypothetical protein